MAKAWAPSHVRASYRGEFALLLPFAADFDIMMKSLSDGVFAIALAHLTITVSIGTMLFVVLHDPVNRCIAGFGFPFSRSYLRYHPVGNRSQ